MKDAAYPVAMKEFFGARPGTKGTATEFMAELKALTDEDKEFFRKELASVGFKVK
jgi:hypothetical protein